MLNTNESGVRSLLAPSKSGERLPLAERVRLLFVVPTLHGGGAERVIATLAAHVHRSRFDLHLAALTASGAYADQIPADVQVHELRRSRMRWAVPRLASLVRKLRPDVILSTLIETNVILLLLRPVLPKKTRLVIRETLNPSVLLRDFLPLPTIWRQAYKRLYPRADAIVGQSRAMRHDICQTVPVASEKVRLIYNGVDCALIADRARAPNPYAHQGPNLVAAGRLHDQKNFSVLLDAFALVQRDLPGSRLTILGTGPQASLLRRRSVELRIEHAVDFAGFQDNPFAYYRYADLYVQTSKCEGLPNVLLEALSLGTPAVAFPETGATAEIAEIAGSVRLVTETTAEAFAGAIVDVLRGPRPVLHGDAFRTRFSVESMVAEYERLFSALVVGSGRS